MALPLIPPGWMAPMDSFERVYGELEETVRLLDAGGQTLDEAIALYEKGMSLAKRCQDLLDAAELRIITLQQAATGSAG